MLSETVLKLDYTDEILPESQDRSVSRMQRDQYVWLSWGTWIHLAITTVQNKVFHKTCSTLLTCDALWSLRIVVASCVYSSVEYTSP